MPRKPERVARLGWLFEGEWDVDSAGPNSEAAEETVAALRSMSRLEDVDAAAIVTFVSLARAVDSDPTNAALWREYRGAEADLRLAGGDGDLDPLAELAAQFEAEMGDT